ncbi:MAG: LEA type 2 family protein [Nibricoccus sp.]
MSQLSHQTALASARVTANVGYPVMSTRSFERRVGWGMAVGKSCLFLLLTGAMLMLASCANLRDHEPIQVSVAGIESLPGEGLEVRMLVKLRVQNPNDTAIDYNGVSLKLDVQGDTYASGVSDARGTIPRFGEAVIDVPVTMSTLRLAFQAFGHVRDGKAPEKLHYKLKGKLGGSPFGSMKFATEGDLDLSALGQ